MQRRIKAPHTLDSWDYRPFTRPMRNIRMSRGRYPDWVHRAVGEDQKAKRVNGHYYLYNVEGGREVYIGVITEEGIRYKQKEHVEFEPYSVYEYGASRVLYEICPSLWKKQRGSSWREDLLSIISEMSPRSYLLKDGAPASTGTRHLAKKKLKLYLREQYQTSIEELVSILGGIMLLVNEETGEKYLSKAPDDALAIADKYGVRLEELS